MKINNSYETHQSSQESQPIMGDPSSCLPQAGQIQTLLPASSR